MQIIIKANENKCSLYIQLTMIQLQLYYTIGLGYYDVKYNMYNSNVHSGYVLL